MDQPNTKVVSEQRSIVLSLEWHLLACVMFKSLGYGYWTQIKGDTFQSLYMVQATTQYLCL